MKFIAVREEDRRRLAEFLRRQRHAG
jgi:hypothetical protein